MTCRFPATMDLDVTKDLHRNVAAHLPVVARRQVDAMDEFGAAWLAGLDGVVADLSAQWDFQVREFLSGGTAALVARVVTSAGEARVLKLSIPGLDPKDSQTRVLALGQGRGYARLFERDTGRGAILMEALGPSLSEQGFSESVRQDIICATLRQAWRPAELEDGFQSGAEKAESLSAFTHGLWRKHGSACSPAVLARSDAFAQDRRRAFDPDLAVLCHGDAHQWNTLKDPVAEGFKFVDPEGIFIEPAYDLSVPMREDSDSLLAGDPAQLGLQRCMRLATITGLDPAAIWAWGFMERVSTGLLCLDHQMDEAGDMLRVAEAWADVEPPQL